MKKLVTGILIVILVLSSVACSKSSTTKEDSMSSGQTSVSSSRPTTTTNTPAPEITLEIPRQNTEQGQLLLRRPRLSAQPLHQRTA